MYLKSLALFVSIFAPVLSAYAGSSAVTLIFNAGVIRDQNQNPAQVGAIGMLVADTSGNGFSSGSSLIGSTLNAGSTLGGSDNQIISTFSVQLIPSIPGNPADPQTDTQFSINISVPDSIAQGTALALYWFPSITSAGTVLSSGSSYYYGFYTNSTPDTVSGSLIGYAVPAAGSWTLATWDKITLGDPGALATQQNMSALYLAAVPEPSSVALVATGGVLVAGRMLRRRKNG